MPTLQAFRREMLRRDVAAGRVEAIASVTVTTIVVTRLKVGTVQAGKFAERWLLRPQAALSGGVAVDRERLCSDYASSTGTLTHAGANYTDTTATDEEVEILEHEPYRYDLAVQRALATTRFLDRELAPLRMDGRYHLGALFDWIDEPSTVRRVGRRTDRVLTRNRHFEKWNGYSTAGALVPDGWTLSGSGATFAREETNVRRGPYALSVTRAGTDALVEQIVEVNVTGVGADSLRGEKVTGVVVGRSGNASSLTVTVESLDYAGNALSSSASDAHDGDDDYQELSVEHTVDDAAERIRLRAVLAVDETAEVDELYLLSGTLDDTARRDAWSTVWLDERPTYEQGQPVLYYGRRSPMTGHLMVESYRPYAQFDQDRIDAGLADADESDAPLAVIAEGALHYLYAGLEPDWEEAATPLAQRARKHYRRFSQLRASHLMIPQDGRSAGFHLPPRDSSVLVGRMR